MIQSRNKAKKLKHEFLADAREFGWNFLARIHRARHARPFRRARPRQRSRSDWAAGVELAFYRLLSAGGGFTLEAPDKTINYSKTPQSARYAFTFWAFPRADYVKNLKDYVKWADELLQAHEVPLQHAARVVFHPQGSELAALIHLGRRHHLARSDSRAERS